VVTDTRIRADTDTHRFNIGTETLGQIGHLVHKADLGGKHGVGRVLGQLGRAHIHHDHLVVIAVIGCIALAHQLFDALGIGANHNTRRLREILDGGAFLEEFRIGADVEFNAGATLGQCCPHGGPDLVGGAHRHRGLVDHNLVAIHMGSDSPSHREHILEIRRAVLIRRGTHRDKLDLAKGNRRRRIGSEMQPALGDIALHHGFKARLIDRDHTIFKPGDFAGVDIHTDDVMADIGQTGTGDQTDVAGTKDSDIHKDPLAKSRGIIPAISVSCCHPRRSRRSTAKSFRHPRRSRRSTAKSYRG